ncbi:MAG TPA: hypothetical protein VN643_16070 [Pyrinomonadaceae bacterium]|nr:hypothetical protein [Pyrinomonadaceae bacterium]
MIKRTLALMVLSFVAAASLGLNIVRAQGSTDSEAVQKVRTKVTKLGLGPKARVEAKLHDQTKVRGYISAVNANSFTITEQNTGTTRDLNYADVAEVKKPGGGLSTRTWIILGGAATAATVVGFTVLKPVLCDGGAGC